MCFSLTKDTISNMGRDELPRVDEMEISGNFVDFWELPEGFCGVVDVFEGDQSRGTDERAVEIFRL